MIIPETLKIGNLTYKITYEDDDTFEKCGKGYMLKQYIKLNSSMSPELKAETFLHEIIHQILDQKAFSDESKDEKLVDTISGGLYQVLNDNGLLKDVEMPTV